MIGGEVNIGARLQQAAEPREVLVGSTTHELVKERSSSARCERSARRSPTARSPRGPCPAGAAIDAIDDPVRRSSPRARAADRHSERVRERRRAHLVTLLGEPGIGKTRVVEEFLDALDDDVTVLSGRPSQYEEQVTFWPLGQMVLTAIEGDEDMPAEELLERLRGSAAEWVGPEEAEKVAHR